MLCAISLSVTTSHYFECIRSIQECEKKLFFSCFTWAFQPRCDLITVENSDTVAPLQPCSQAPCPAFDPCSIHAYRESLGTRLHAALVDNTKTTETIMALVMELHVHRHTCTGILWAGERGYVYMILCLTTPKQLTEIMHQSHPWLWNYMYTCTQMYIVNHGSETDERSTCTCTGSLIYNIIGKINIILANHSRRYYLFHAHTDSRGDNGSKGKYSDISKLWGRHQPLQSGRKSVPRSIRRFLSYSKVQKPQTWVQAQRLVLSDSANPCRYTCR